MIFYLIYTSRANRLMAADELMQLLEQSRRNNAARDITGMLLYMEVRFLDRLEGRFMQLLEGSEAQVRATYGQIIADDRHHGILLLVNGELPERQFPGWSMGFGAVDPAEINDPAYTEINRDLFDNPPFHDDAKPLRFLKSFYQLNDL